MFHLCSPPRIHLPHGRQPRPNMALAPPLHLVRRRTQCRHHLLLRADTKVSDPALLAQVPQLRRLKLRFSSTLRPRRLRRYSSQFQLKYFEELVLQAGK